MSVLMRLGGFFINVLVVIILKTRSWALYFTSDRMPSGRRSTFDLHRLLVGSLSYER